MSEERSETEMGCRRVASKRTELKVRSLSCLNTSFPSTVLDQRFWDSCGTWRSGLVKADHEDTFARDSSPADRIKKLVRDEGSGERRSGVRRMIVGLKLEVTEITINQLLITENQQQQMGGAKRQRRRASQKKPTLQPHLVLKGGGMMMM
ncbi:hypothetical protein Bca101_008193 [Brassica carinata]